MTRFRFMTLFILLLIPTGANGAETGEWTPLHEAAADGGGGGCSRDAHSCASAGAFSAAQALVIRIVVSEQAADIPRYDRGDWRHWIDADGDCQDTRQETLIAESSVPVTFKNGDSCRVASGRWTDPYTGEVVDDPGKLDIDHVVPLANAHVSGGHSWSAERKEAYANSLAYRGHLEATTALANKKKGSKTPAEWQPPDRTYWCQYATDWAVIKREWRLTATDKEADALCKMLTTCAHSVYLQVSTAAPIPAISTPTPIAPTVTPAAAPTPAVSGATPAAPTPASPTPTPQASPPDTKYDPDGPDRNCSDFDTWKEAQVFYEAAGGPETDRHRLDRDSDEIACESLPGAPS